jgi:hypothetical protein
VRAALVCVVLGAALVSCSEAPPDPYASFDRAYGSNHAVNDEYAIEAEFPENRVVCVSDALTHLHGFHQFLAGDCSGEGSPPGNRALSVWADYNAAEFSRDQAVDVACSDATRHDALDVTVPDDRGWAASCLEKGDDGKEQFIVVFVHKDSEPAGGFGPDNIDVTYTMRLYTDAAHRDADLERFETFLRRVRLADTSLSVKR